MYGETDTLMGEDGRHLLHHNSLGFVKSVYFYYHCKWNFLHLKFLESLEWKQLGQAP